MNFIIIIQRKDLRDIYYRTMEDIIFNWKDCEDKDLVRGLEKEKEEVYTADIKKVISRIMEDNWFYEVKEV